jgi:hypothetical protein
MLPIHLRFINEGATLLIENIPEGKIAIDITDDNREYFEALFKWHYEYRVGLEQRKK